MEKEQICIRWINIHKSTDIYANISRYNNNQINENQLGGNIMKQFVALMGITYAQLTYNNNQEQKEKRTQNITKTSHKKHRQNWPQICYQTFKILIIGGCGSGKTN